MYLFEREPAFNFCHFHPQTPELVSSAFLEQLGDANNVTISAVSIYQQERQLVIVMVCVCVRVCVIVCVWVCILDKWFVCHLVPLKLHHVYLSPKKVNR